MKDENYFTEEQFNDFMRIRDEEVIEARRFGGDYSIASELKILEKNEAAKPTKIREIEAAFINNSDKVFRKLNKIWKNGSFGMSYGKLESEKQELDELIPNIKYLAENYSDETGEVHPNYSKFSHYAGLLYNILEQEINIRKMNGEFR